MLSAAVLRSRAPGLPGAEEAAAAGPAARPDRPPSPAASPARGPVRRAGKSWPPSPASRPGTSFRSRMRRCPEPTGGPPMSAPENLILSNRFRCFDGWQHFYRHAAAGDGLRHALRAVPAAPGRARAGAAGDLPGGADLQRGDLSHQGGCPAGGGRARSGTAVAGHEPAGGAAAGRRRGLRLRPERGLLPGRHRGALVGPLPDVQLRGAGAAGPGHEPVPRGRGADRIDGALHGRPRRADHRAEAPGAVPEPVGAGADRRTEPGPVGQEGTAPVSGVRPR